MRSMTGYGRSRAVVDGTRLEVELRSVNHKFCEVCVRLPKLLLSFESQLKKRVQDRFHRGRVDLLVNLNGSNEPDRQLELDLHLARQYRKLLQELKTRLRLQGEIDLFLFSNFRNIIAIKEQTSVSRRLLRTVEKLVDQAATSLEKMRAREGRSLGRDLVRRIEKVRRAIVVIKRRVPLLNLEHKRKLEGRIKRLTEGILLNEARVEQEAALFAVRSDVSEEIVRLESHVAQFMDMLRAHEAVGRSMDFLIQEMNREINTLGSKGNDILISRQVIKMKSELEKMREQVQNIE